jgi:branched-chain amino acid transport system substrate-binding protein
MFSRDGTFTRRDYLKSTSAAAAVTGITGCTQQVGGSDDDSIVVAATVPETGDLSSVGTKVKTGYELGVQYINENGGVDGKEIELILRDDESDAQTLREQLTQIVGNNAVDVIWGSFSSLLVTAGSSIAENEDIPFLGITFAYMEPHLDNDFEWTFAPFLKSRDIARGTLGLLDSVDGPENVAIWEPNTGWGEEMADEWEETLSDDGYNIALRQKYSLGTNDFSTLISQAKDANTDVLLSNPVPPGAITAVNQMKESQFAPELTMFVRGSAPEAFWGALKQDAAYVCNMPGWATEMNTTGSQSLIELFREQESEDDEALPDVNIGPAFGVPQVTAQAIGEAGSTENTAIQESLLSTEFDSVMGTFTFDENGMPNEGEMQAPVIQWWDGRQTQVYPANDNSQSKELEYPAPTWSER